MPPAATPTANSLARWYRLFFLWIEPISTLAGAYFALFAQRQYLDLTHGPSSPGPFIPVSVGIVMTQLGNLYLMFAYSEAFVLRASADLAVWRALMLGMLIADFGHLYSVWPLAPQVYYDVWNYNAIDWGNVAFVYVGASTRIAFLLGVGVGGSATKAKPRARGRPKTSVAATAAATPKTPRAVKSN